MFKNKRFSKNYEKHKISFTKGQLMILMCIGLIAIVAFTMINIQSAQAGTSGKTLAKTPEYPMMPGNYTELQYCDTCHYFDSDISITVTKDHETQSDITYSVTGSSEKFEGIEGWAVFDEFQNNIVHGHFSGFFTLPKDGKIYKVFWVDNGTKDPPDPDHPGGSANTNITTTNNTPPSPPTITGPTTGKPGQTYEYTFVSTDPENNNIFYYIDWGDGTYEDWFGPYGSGVAVTKSHSWSGIGTYTIKAKAKDIPGGLESNWSTLTVVISSEPKLKIRLKMFSIGQVIATIENVGEGSLSNIKWNITATGGILRLIKRINANNNGTIATLGVGDKQQVSTLKNSIVLRLCVAKVTVTATVGEQTFTRDQYVFVIGRLIFARPLLFK